MSHLKWQKQVNRDEWLSICNETLDAVSLVTFCIASTFSDCNTTSCSNSTSAWTVSLCIVLRNRVMQEMRPWLTSSSLWITTTTFQSQLYSYMVTGMACSHKYHALLGFKLCSFYVSLERLWCTHHTEHPGCGTSEFPRNGYNVQYWLVVCLCLVISDTAIRSEGPLLLLS